MNMLRTFGAFLLALIVSYLIYLSGWVLLPMLPFILYGWLTTPRNSDALLSRFCIPLFYLLCGFAILNYGSFALIQIVEYPDYGNALGILITVFNLGCALYSARLTYVEVFQGKRLPANAYAPPVPPQKDETTNKMLPPEEDYEKWYKIIFSSAAKKTQENAQSRNDDELIHHLMSFFDTGLFIVVLATKNHDFERYCFRRLKESLAGSPRPDSGDAFIKLYNRIIDVFNECMKDGSDEEMLFGAAIAESVVDYFYQEGDDFEHSCHLRSELEEYMKRMAFALSEDYRNK